MKNLKYIYLFVLLGIVSCDNYLDIEPVGQVIPKSVDEYRSFLTSAYSTAKDYKVLTTYRGDELQLEIADNGVGMDLETRSNLFKTKYMKSTFGTNNENGSGLGLSICKEMVENNGGTIWVSSVQKQLFENQGNVCILRCLIMICAFAKSATSHR